MVNASTTDRASAPKASGELWSRVTAGPVSPLGGSVCGVPMTRGVRVAQRRARGPMRARHHDARRAWAIGLCLLVAFAWFLATEIVLSPRLFGR